jgi:RHS repeat-associated protein
VTTDANGNVLSQQAHYPFGENWYQSGATPNSPPPSPLTTDQQFTMYLRDTESGNDDAPAREFINRLGRFSVVDPVAGDSSNPQSLNRYAYAMNDPIDLLDPEGEYVCITNCGGTPSMGIGGWDDFGDLGLLDMAAGYTAYPGCPYNDCSESERFQIASSIAFIGMNMQPDFGALGAGLSTNISPPSAKDLCNQGLQMAGQTTAAVDRANDIWNTLQAAGDDNGIDPSLLAAIGVEETGFNNEWQECTTDASCAKANGAGIFQIDLGVPSNANVSVQQAFDPTWAANYAANLLSNNMSTLARNFPNFTPAQLLQATAASYNMGTPEISGNPSTIDVGTNPNGTYGATVNLLTFCF